MLLETTLLAAIIGPIALEAWIAAAPRLQRHICEPPRRRRYQLDMAKLLLC
jgi:hypothetical protein